jgi:hypothetical protein
LTIVNTFAGINMFLPLVMNGAGGPTVAARLTEARLSNMAAQATASDAGVFASDGYNLIGDGSGGEFANGAGGDKVGSAPARSTPGLPRRQTTAARRRNTRCCRAAR